MSDSKRDEMAKQHGNGIANPVLRSMISSMSRDAYALVLSDSYKSGYDAGYAEAQEQAKMLVEALEEVAIEHKFYIVKKDYFSEIVRLNLTADEALEQYRKAVSGE